jgi:phosphate transport system substrate-binding protein
MVSCRTKSYKHRSKLIKDDTGVSPIVATLILIVVAIIGGAAVALIMGSFSSSVSQQANSGNTQNAASTQILVGGATSMQPFSNLLAKAYDNNNTGVQVSVQGGGNTAGELGVGMGDINIGSTTQTVPSSIISSYPNIQIFDIGGSGVAVIVNSNVNLPVVYAPDLYKAYTQGLSAVGANWTSAGITKLYTRSDSSAAADSFASYISNGLWTSGSSIPTTYATGENGDQAMLQAVETTPGSLGYVDYGSLGLIVPSGITVPGIWNNATISVASGAAAGTSTSTLQNNIKQALNSYFSGTTATAYPGQLVYPLEYITNGNPSSLEKSYINWAQEPQNEWAYQQTGYFSMGDVYQTITNGSP